jgi:HD-GYP domain-containing protein (c-di-GMP phosphodiesterase class II)
MRAGLQRTFHGLLNLLAAALDVDDEGPAGHCSRVALLAHRAAKVLGDVDPAVVYYGGLVHDVGGAGMEEHLVAHAERGFDDKTAQSHPLIGKLLISACPALAPLYPLVERHHERLDGRGFPSGLRGAEVPLGASLLHLADALEVGLRACGPGERTARAKGILLELQGTAVPSAAAEAAAAAIEREPELLATLYDPQRLKAAHGALEEEVSRLLPAGDRLELLTPLLVLLARVVDDRHHLTATTPRASRSSRGSWPASSPPT